MSLKIDIIGESHGKEIVVRIDGIPKGAAIDVEELQKFVDRRKSSNSPWSTPRQEADTVMFREGMAFGFTTGGVIEAYVENNSKKSQDYNALKYVPRPSHADYAASVKDGSCCPVGGGRFSGRLTVGMCIAGGIAIQMLRKMGIEIAAYIASIGKVNGKSYKEELPSYEEIRLAQQGFPSLSDGQSMIEEVAVAKNAQDSVGGKIECVVFGLKAGVGDNLFDGLEGAIAYSLYAIPAVKGVEFGDGFALSELRGSQANDALRYKDGKVVTLTNHNGGINGGISNGMPITLSVAIKPTPSIEKTQESVNLETKQNTQVTIHGRHDACIVPRAVAVVEAAVAIALLKRLIKEEKIY